MFRQLAAQLAQPLNISRSAAKIGLDTRTANNYAHVLEQLFVIQRLPAWGRTLGSRVSASPKLHLVDSGVAARALRLTADRLSCLDPSAATELGHLLETFVFGELAAQASWLDGLTLWHYRTREDVEVDLVIEDRHGGVTGVEVKAATDVRDADLKGLRHLRTLVGDQFVTGVVFYLGDHSYTNDGMWVLPVDRLWSSESFNDA